MVQRGTLASGIILISMLSVAIVAAVAVAEATFPLLRGDPGGQTQTGGQLETVGQPEAVGQPEMGGQHEAGGLLQMGQPQTGAQPETAVDRVMLVRVFIGSRADIEAIAAHNFDIAAVGHEGYVDVLATGEGLAALDRMGFTTEIVVHDLGTIEVDPEYHTYAEMLEVLEQLETEHPEIARLYDIGDSWERRAGYPGHPGHDIWAMKVSDNVDEDEAEPALLYCGEHHAREPLSLEMCLYLLHYLLSNYGTNPEITQWIDTTEIWFVPLVNPDGHWLVLEYSQTHPQFELWRKNTRDNDNDHILYEYLFYVAIFHEGVDLNRNYIYKWGYDNEGSSGFIWDQTYRGPWAGSEPETQALIDLIARENFVAGISYHTYGGWVLYPWGYQVAETPDHAVFATLGEAMAAYNGYVPGVASQQLYRVNGEFADHAYGKHGMLGYTFEMADQFIPPGSEILYHCELNREASLELLRRLAGPGLRGTVWAEGTPAEAYLRFATSSDDLLWFRRSDPETGFYAKLLQPGTYRVTAIAPNYAPATYPGVVVGQGGPTTLDIEVSGVSHVTLELVPDATVIPRGGELGYTALLVNTMGEHGSYTGEAHVTLPNGNPYGGNPIAGPVGFTLAPHDTLDAYFVHPVPADAPLGIYRYEALVRADPEIIIASDEFTFEVVAR